MSSPDDLGAAVQTVFNHSVDQDLKIKKFLRCVQDGTASFKDVAVYAQRLGGHASGALIKNITADVLPGGKMTQDIAEATVRRLLIQNYELTTDAAVSVQKIIDEARGLGINAVKGKRPDGRIKALINSMCADDADFKKVQSLMGEPVINVTQSVVDTFVNTNVEWSYKAGMSPKIIREAEPASIRIRPNKQPYEVPCEWCASLAGKYDYDSAPKKIFQRHEGCRCTVTFVRGARSQNAHTKRWEESEETLKRRKNYT